MTLKYEAQKLISEIKPQKAWSFEEENIFKEIMQYFYYYQEANSNSQTDGTKRRGNFISYPTGST